MEGKNGAKNEGFTTLGKNDIRKKKDSHSWNKSGHKGHKIPIAGEKNRTKRQNFPRLAAKWATKEKKHPQNCCGSVEEEEEGTSGGWSPGKGPPGRSRCREPS